MEKSSDNNELKQHEKNSQNAIPAGVDNLERNIHDTTSRYDDLDFPNRSDEARVD